MKITMIIKVWEHDDTTGEQKLVRIYPCSEVYNRHDNSNMVCTFNDGNSKYTMDVVVNYWNNEYYTITAV